MSDDNSMFADLPEKMDLEERILEESEKAHDALQHEWLEEAASQVQVRHGHDGPDLRLSSFFHHFQIVVSDGSLAFEERFEERVRLASRLLLRLGSHGGQQLISRDRQRRLVVFRFYSRFDGRQEGLVREQEEKVQGAGEDGGVSMIAVLLHKPERKIRSTQT